MSMDLAFVLFRYFPYGGLERDMLAIARACRQRGHRVTIYTSAWQGARPDDLEVVLLPVRAWTNHGRNRAFVRRFQSLQLDGEAVVVGFNKMPGLHVYYAADTCFAEKAARRGIVYRMTPRARCYLDMERAVFGPESHTRALMISSVETGIYRRHYHTPGERLHPLPPGIRRERIRPPQSGLREQLRQRYGLSPEQRLLLMIGSDFRRKGLDRCLRGLAALPEAERAQLCLWVAGQDRAAPFERLAQSLGVADRLRILGGRDDVSELLWAADVLLHPAYSENTGTVLLEAMVAGVPVIASSACGYAHYIREQDMGIVLDEPLDAEAMAAAMQRVLIQDGEAWRERGARFACTADVFSMPEHAARYIEASGGGPISGESRGGDPE